MSQRLLKVKGGQLTESGLWPAAHPLDAPLWVDGRNILFQEGGPQKMQGYSEPVSQTPDGHIRGASALQDEASTQRLYFGDKSKLYKWNGSTLSTEGSGYTGQDDETSTADATTWEFERFGNFMLATNNVDAVQVDKDDGTGFNDLAGTPFTRAAILLKLGPHLLAANTSNGAAWIEWCAPDDIEAWTVGTDEGAGNNPIRDFDGEVIAGSRVGDRIGLVGKNQIVEVNYIGPPSYFGARLRLQGIGAVGRRSIVQANGQLFGLGQYGFWRTDLRQFSYIGTREVWDYVRQNWNEDQLSKVCCDYDSENQLITWSIPFDGNSEPSISFVYSLENGSWTLIDHGWTAAVPSMSVFSQPVRIVADGSVRFYSEGLNAAGAALTAWVQTKPLDMDQPRAWKYVDALSLQMRRLAGTVQVRLGWQENHDDAIQWESYQTLDDGFEPLFWRLAGRFVSLEVQSNTVDADWAMTGGELWGEMQGLEF